MSSSRAWRSREPRWTAPSVSRACERRSNSSTLPAAFTDVAGQHRMSAFACSLVLSLRRACVAAHSRLCCFRRTPSAPTPSTIGGLAYVNHGLCRHRPHPGQPARQVRRDLRLRLRPRCRSELMAAHGGRLSRHVLPAARSRLQPRGDLRLSRAAEQARRSRSIRAGERGAAPVAARQPNVTATLADTIPLTDACRRAAHRPRPVDGGSGRPPTAFPTLPQAANGLVSIDSEVAGAAARRQLLHRRRIRTLRLSLLGRRPHARGDPAARGASSRSARAATISPPTIPGPARKPPEPRNPETGRANNQGFEGLALTPGGKFLVVILQSATRQDGGIAAEPRVHPHPLLRPRRPRPAEAGARARGAAAGVHTTPTASGRSPRRANSLALDETHFLLLCRDQRQRLRHRRRDLALSQGRDARHLAGDQYRGLEV